MMAASLIVALSFLGGLEPQVVATAPRGDAAQAALAAPASDAVEPPQAQPPHGLSTDEQISRWLSARAPERRDVQAPLWDEPEERRLRGEVSAGVGTGGYRDMSAWASMPLGERGELSIGISQTRNAPWGWSAYGPYGRHDPARPFGHDPMRPYGWILPGGGVLRHGFDALGPYDGSADRPFRDSRGEDRPSASLEPSGRP